MTATTTVPVVTVPVEQLRLLVDVAHLIELRSDEALVLEQVEHLCCAAENAYLETLRGGAS